MDHGNEDGGVGYAHEADGSATGVPAGVPMPGDLSATTGVPATSHWRESTITEPGLDNRANVFFAAVEMTRMPMILTDPNLPDNPVVFANNAFFDLTGYSKEEVEGRNCRFLQGPQTDRATVRELREAIAERRAYAVEILNYRRDGSPFWNGVFIGPVFDTDGKLLYFFASQLDVTRRRTSEQSFRQAQKMEAIGQLTAGLAHDFNNILQVISGNIEIALAGGPSTGRQLETARRAAERGVKLTRQLLAFARKTRLEPKPVDLSALVNDFAEMLDSSVGGRIELRLDLRRRLRSCSVDPIHLEMALLNLVNNARDASPEGGTITVGTSILRLNGDAETLDLTPGEYVCLEVRDEGEGMPPHVLERATEPFFTTKEAGRGTGLGLAMVHGFVRQSLGRLLIESDPGNGTRIRMVFPITDEAPVHGPRATDPVPPERRGDEQVVLVVEDSDDVRELARQNLESLGYRVTAVRSGEDAVDILERGDTVNLLFTDLVMPGGMNGLDLAERAQELRPGLPVLLTTGYNEELSSDGPRTPSMDVLGKPYRRADLADRVGAALAGRNAARPPTRPEHGTPHAG